MSCKYRRSKYTRRKYSRASNPPAITLVKTKRGMQMLETTPRYDVMLFGKFYFQLYYNMRGYVGYLPTPDGLKLDIGEHGIGVFKKEIAKLNREWAQKRVDDKDGQWLKGSNPRRKKWQKGRNPRGLSSCGTPWEITKGGKVFKYAGKIEGNIVYKASDGYYTYSKGALRKSKRTDRIARQGY